MKRWLGTVLLLGLALAQSPRWEGVASYRGVPGVATAAGPNLDQSYIEVFPAQAPLRGTAVLVPGLLGGASSFEALARRLVVAAPGWEAWAWDRRANGLEDRSGFASADPWGFYQRYTPPEFPFLKDWGLAVHLGDLDHVVSLAAQQGPVVLVGHSLGAGLVGLYALQHPQKIQGLILLDGSPSLPRLSAEQYRKGGVSAFGPTAGLEDLLAGRALPYISVLGLGPVGLAQAEAQAFMAAQAPQADAPKDWAAWPASRMAAALARIDDRYQPFAIFSASLGRSSGREGLNVLGWLLGTPTYTVRGPRGPRVEWLDTGEATDPLEFLQLYANRATGFSEWFFPYRLSLDMGAWNWAILELQPRRLGFEVLALGAGRGLLRDGSAFGGLTEVFPGTAVRLEILPNLTHLDILTGRNGPAVGPIARYLNR